MIQESYSWLRPYTAGLKIDRVQQVRTDVLNTVLTMLVLLSVPGLVTSLARIADTGFRAIMLIQITLFFLICAAAIFRHRLSFHIRTGVVFISLFLVGLASILQWGLIGSFYFLIIGITVLSLLYGPRVGVGLILLVILFLLYVTWGVNQGTRTFDYDANAYNLATSSWISRTTNLALFLMIVVAATSQVFHSFIATIRDLQTEIAHHKQTQAELEHYKEQLESLVNERTRQLEMVNQELESFAYSVSHDLKAPLRSVNGFCQVLRTNYHDTLDEKGQHYLERVINGTRTMQTLIEALLQLSRVTRQEIHTRPVNLSTLAQQILTELREASPENTAEITIAPDMIVHGDQTLLQSALKNLLDNAWKYSQHQSVRNIVVGSQHTSEETVFFVRDNGAGFDTQYAHKLFTPFQRLHSAREFEGTGIGLATVQRIIHRHGGRIWAEATPNEGATFFFTVPLKQIVRGSSFPKAEGRMQPHSAANV